VLRSLIPRSDYAVNVATLMTGTVPAQVVSLVSAPILARIYAPNDFGVLALFLAFTSCLGVVIAGRYDMAILLPRHNDDAINIAALAIGVALVGSCLTLLALVVWNKPICELVGQSSLSPHLYLVAPSVMLAGANQVLYHWSNRFRAYHVMGGSKFLQNTTFVVCAALLSLVLTGPKGLVLGYLLAQVVSTSVLATWALRNSPCSWSAISCRRIVALSHRYRNLPRYSVPANLVNSAANQIPVVMLSVFFGSQVVGLFSLTQRVLATPTSLIGTALGDVFRERASVEVQCRGQCRDTYMRTFMALIKFGILPTIVLLVAAPAIFRLVFGGRWEVSGEFARIMAPLCFLQLVVSPLSSTLLITGRQQTEFTWQLALLVSTGVAMMAGCLSGKPLYSVAFFAFAYCLMYILYLLLSYRAAIAPGSQIGCQ
jgi:O-antigen/teichoic acid export membrane protein